MNSAYEFSDLCGGYNGANVIKKIAGLIMPGRVTAIIGPNGCGKSTLIKILSGALPYTGRLDLSRRALQSYSSRELGRRVGVVPQYTQFAHEFSVYDVIGFGRLPYSSLFSPITEADEQVILAAARSVGVEPLLFRRISSLSGGERQRAVVAMVIAQEPEIFLLDEPTSSLDPMHSVKIFTILRELAQKGRTVVAAAHDINTAIAYSDDYIAMKNGEILETGDVRAIGPGLLGSLYDTVFYKYRSKSGEVAWHSCIGQ